MTCKLRTWAVLQRNLSPPVPQQAKPKPSSSNHKPQRNGTTRPKQRHSHSKVGRAPQTPKVGVASQTLVKMGGASPYRKSVASQLPVGVALPAPAVQPSLTPSVSKTPPSKSLQTPQNEVKYHNKPSVPQAPSIYPRLPSLSSLTPSPKPVPSLSLSPYQHKNNVSISGDDDIYVPTPPVPSKPYHNRGSVSSYESPPASPHPPSSPSSKISTDSTDGSSSGVVTTITSWLGARVKNIIGRLQEVASPSPRRPLSRTPSAVTPSPSAPSKASFPVSPDSISIDELDFSQDDSRSGAAVYLHVPSPPKNQSHGTPASSIPRSPSLHSSHSVESRYDWELLPGDVEICKKTNGELWLLGKGGCGQVYRGLKDKVDDVAVKVIRLQGCDPRSAVAQFKQEIDMISKLRHQHIVQFYGACIQPSCLFMVTELMDTDLFSALRQGSEYTWDREHGKEVLVGIASGLHHLHTRRPPIVHRDIKSPNILVVNGLSKIADVGIANTMAATDMTAQRGFTVAWAAPEVILRKRANEKIDIWSFGIILWEVITGRIPTSRTTCVPIWGSKSLAQFVHELY